jgi:hypothetical protein
MPSHLHELLIPERAARDPKAREILRFWAVDGEPHMAIRRGLCDDPFVWGIVIVDLARHVANAFELSEGMDRSTTLNRIKAGFDAEWNSPTDTPTGGFVDE